VWAIDFQYDQPMDSRKLKLLKILDEYCRDCLAIRIGRRCKAVDAIAAIEEILGQYSAPPPSTDGQRAWVYDPCTARVVYRQWIGNGTHIPPGSLWDNSFVESFNGKLRNEFLNIKLFASLAEAKVLAEQHRIEYNVYRPDSALSGRTHLEALQQWKADRSPQQLS